MSAKGRGRKQRSEIAVPVGADVIARLKPLLAGRAGHEPLLQHWVGVKGFGHTTGPVRREAWRAANQMQKGWRTALAAAGLPYVEPYGLRHSSIVRGLRSGVPMRIVAALHDTSSVDDRSGITARSSWTPPTNLRAARSCLSCLSRVAALGCRVTPGAKRGRKPSPLPTGMVRAVRTRSGVEFYAEGWPEGIGPTAGVAKRNPTGRKPGRPAGAKIVVRAEPSEKRRRSLKTTRDHLLRDRS